MTIENAIKCCNECRYQGDCSNEETLNCEKFITALNEEAT